MLRILSEKKKMAFYNSMLGKDAQVLFERENHNGLMKGFTSNYIRVETQYDEAVINQLENITLTEINGENCKGIIKK